MMLGKMSRTIYSGSKDTRTTDAPPGLALLHTMMAPHDDPIPSQRLLLVEHALEYLIPIPA